MVGTRNNKGKSKQTEEAAALEELATVAESVTATAPAAAPPKAKKLAGRKPGSTGFKQDEVMAMLNVINGIKPLGANQWEEVGFPMRKKASTEGWPPREAGAYQQKYTRLKMTKKPTGDPTCPPDVKQAKRIARSIDAKMYAIMYDGGDGEEEEQEYSAEATATPNTTANSASSSSSSSSSTANSDSGGSSSPIQVAVPTPPKRPASDPLRSNSARQRAKLSHTLDKLVDALATTKAPETPEKAGELEFMKSEMADLKTGLASVLDALKAMSPPKQP
jgi:hypothetical protein